MKVFAVGTRGGDAPSTEYAVTVVKHGDLTSGDGPNRFVEDDPDALAMAMDTTKCTFMTVTNSNRATERQVLPRGEVNVLEVRDRAVDSLFACGQVNDAAMRVNPFDEGGGS